MDQPPTLIEPLTARELKILSLIGEGLSYSEIGQALYIEKATVTWYVQQIYDKLGLEKNQRNHQRALACAHDLGLLGDTLTPTSGTQIDLSARNPYKGLRSFQQGEAGDFFGREALVQQILLRLGETDPLSRFLAVVGPSGCGKSSVLHAGVIPALHQGGVEGSEQWIITNMVPGSHPLDELEAALARVLAKSGIDIMAQLLRDERGLQRVAGMLLPENKELLLFVDQFEEVFSLVADEEQRNKFLSLLSSSVNQPHSRVRVLIALRADFYDRPLMSPPISELFRKRTEVVAPLTADELAQAICLPVKQTGVHVEPGLVVAMVDEVSEHPGLLPLMQYTLTELFDRRQGEAMTLAGYHKIGGIRGALTQQANVLYENLRPSQQALVRQLYMRLVKLGVEGEVLRRRVSRSELLAIGKNMQEVDELIDELANHRLLTLDYDPIHSSAMVEVAHEALIREWNQLRAWLDDSREDIRQQRLLAAAANDWQEAKRDPSYLLTGAHLVQFQSWAQTSQVELGPVENEFLTISIDEKRRHDRRRRITRNLILSLAILVAAVMSGLAIFAIDREQQAQVDRIRAERGTAENRSIQLASYAQAAYKDGRTDLALLLSMEAIDINDPPEISEQTFRTIAQGPGLRAVLPSPILYLRTVSISPDKKTVLVGGCGKTRADLSCSQGKVVLLNIEGEASHLTNDQQIGILDSNEFGGEINDVVFNPVITTDGQITALTASEDGIIILWDVSSRLAGKVIRHFDGQAGAVNEVAYSPDGRQFLSAYDQGTIIFWDPVNGKEIRRLHGGSGAVTSVAFSHDGKMALSACEDGTTILWDVDNKTEVKRYPNPPGVWLTRLAFGPANKYGRSTVWGVSSENAIHVWDLESTQEVAGMPPASSPYRDVAFTPDGEKAALAFEGMILLINPALNGDEQRLLQKSQAGFTVVTALAISSDNSLLVSGDEEGNIELWNLPMREDLVTIPIYKITSLGNSLLFPDGLHLLSSTGSADPISPTLVKIDLVTDEEEFRYPQLPNPVGANALAIDPEGRYILVGGGNPETVDQGAPQQPYLWVLDANSGEVIWKLDGHRYNVKAVAISPDGRYAFSGSDSMTTGSPPATSGELIMWDLQSGLLARSSALTNDIQSISFSNAGIMAVTCSRTGYFPGATLWEIASGQQVDRYPFSCTDATFSLDDKFIFLNSMTEPSTNKIFQIDINNGKVQRTYDGLNGPILNFNLDPNDRYLFAASRTAGILWDVKTGQVLSEITLPSPGSITWALFRLSKGSAIIVQDNTTRLIDWEFSELPSLASLRIWILGNRYLRPYTCQERELYKNVLPLCE